MRGGSILTLAGDNSSQPFARNSGVHLDKLLGEVEKQCNGDPAKMIEALKLQARGRKNQAASAFLTSTADPADQPSSSDVQEVDPESAIVDDNEAAHLAQPHQEPHPDCGLEFLGSDGHIYLIDENGEAQDVGPPPEEEDIFLATDQPSYDYYSQPGLSFAHDEWEEDFYMVNDTFYEHTTWSISDMQQALLTDIHQPQRPVAIADTGASNALITSHAGRLPSHIKVLFKKELASPVRVGTASDNSNCARELLVIALYTQARFIPNTYYCTVHTCLHLALPESASHVKTVTLLAVNKMNLNNISMSMPGSGSSDCNSTPVLYVIDDPSSYNSSPPGHVEINDRRQTHAQSLRSSALTLAPNGLPLLEHVHLDDILANNGTILSFDTCQPLTNNELRRLVTDSLKAFKHRRGTHSGPIPTHYANAIAALDHDCDVYYSSGGSSSGLTATPNVSTVDNSSSTVSGDSISGTSSSDVRCQSSHSSFSTPAATSTSDGPALDESIFHATRVTLSKVWTTTILIVLVVCAGLIPTGLFQRAIAEPMLSLTVCCTSALSLAYGQMQNEHFGSNITIRSADDLHQDPSSFPRPNVYIDGLSHCDQYYSEAILPFIQDHQPDTVILRDPATVTTSTVAAEVDLALNDFGYSIERQVTDPAFFDTGIELRSQFLVCRHPGTSSLSIQSNRSRTHLSPFCEILDSDDLIHPSLWVPSDAVHGLDQPRTSVGSRAAIVATAGSTNTPVYDTASSSAVPGRSSLFQKLVSDTRNGRSLEESTRHLTPGEIGKALGYTQVDSSFEPLLELSVPASLYTHLVDAAIAHATDWSKFYVQNDFSMTPSSDVAFNTTYHMSDFVEELDHLPTLTPQQLDAYTNYIDGPSDVSSAPSVSTSNAAPPTPEASLTEASTTSPDTSPPPPTASPLPTKAKPKFVANLRNTKHPHVSAAHWPKQVDSNTRTFILKRKRADTLHKARHFTPQRMEQWIAGHPRNIYKLVDGDSRYMSPLCSDCVEARSDHYRHKSRSSGPKSYDQYEAGECVTTDSIYMTQTSHRGNDKALTAVCVKSRVPFSYPHKDNSAETMIKAFAYFRRKFFKESGRHIKVITFDALSTNLSARVDEWLARHDIVRKPAPAGIHQDQGIVEGHFRRTAIELKLRLPALRSVLVRGRPVKNPIEYWEEGLHHWEASCADEPNALAASDRFFGLTRLQVLRGTTEEPTQHILPFGCSCQAIYDLKDRENKLTAANELVYYLYPSLETPKAHVVMRASNGTIFATGRLRFHPIIELNNMEKQAGLPCRGKCTWG